MAGVLITGGAGTIGGALARAIHADDPTLDLNLTWRSRVSDAPGHHHRLDLRDRHSVRALVDDLDPAVVVHTAYRADDPGDIVDATEQVAHAAAATGAQLLHLSTDVVFDGDGTPRSERDEPTPINDYGRWKLAAEHVVRESVPDACITRSSIVVGLDPPDRGCSLALQAARGQRGVEYFEDEMRAPILLEDLVARLSALIRLDPPQRAGVWHLPGPEVMSRAELARRVVTHHGLDPRRISGVPQPAELERPRDLRLVSTRVLPHLAPLRRIGDAPL